MTMDTVTQQSPSEADQTLTANDSKAHNACDECRSRKLKCSGEATGCSRCVTDKVTCRYSPRKKMGRPRKRNREGLVHSSPEFDSWEFGVGTKVERINDSEARTDVFDTQLSSRFYPPTASVSSGSMDLDIGRNSLNMGYPIQTPNDIGANNFNDGEINLDLLTGSTGSKLPDFDGCLSAATGPQTSLDSNSIYNDASQRATSCQCLQVLYSTLSLFASPSIPSFPYSMSLLKQATGVGRDVLQCEVCPQWHNTALQNSMMLGTLMNLIINDYAKLLRHIDERASNEDQVVYRMGEYFTPETAHLHTGTLDCPMGISIDLSGAEWRTLARKAIRKEVVGDHPGDRCIALVLGKMKERQMKWHGEFSRDGHQHENSTPPDDSSARTSNRCICTQVMYIDQLKKSVEALGL